MQCLKTPDRLPDAGRDGLRDLTATEDLQIEKGPGKNIEIGAIILSEAGIISRLQEHYKHTRIFSHVTPSTDLVDLNILNDCHSVKKKLILDICL